MLVEQQTLVIPERVIAVRVICRACEEEHVELHVDGHFGATVDGSLRLEDDHGWVTSRCGHRIELIRAGSAPKRRPARQCTSRSPLSSWSLTASRRDGILAPAAIWCTARRGGPGMEPSDRCGTPASPERPGGPFSYSSERANGKHSRRVLVVADVSVHRDSLVEELDREPGILVVGATSDPVQSVADCLNLSPDLVLLDVAAEERVPAIGALVAAIPGVKVVAVAVPETEGDIIDCAEAGVAACVTREASFDELVATMERVGSGESLCSPQVAAVLLRRVAALAAERSVEPAAPLTSREREILDLIAEGLSNKQIARLLCIEVPTVKNHVHNLLEKLDVHSRHEAAALLQARQVPVTSSVEA